jgi:hypothetical protein
MPNNIALEIGKLKLTKICGAYKKFFGGYANAPFNKRDACAWLVTQLETGNLSMSDILSAPEETPSSTVDNTRVDAISAVASRAESVALDAINKATTLSQTLVDLKKKVKTLEVTSNNSVDGDAIRIQVNKLIADAFAPFKQAVQDAGVESVIADISGVHVVETKTVEFDRPGPDADWSAGAIELTRKEQARIRAEAQAKINAALEAALEKQWSPSACDGVAMSPAGLNSDIHASAAYRAHLITVLAKRAVAQTV